MSKINKRFANHTPSPEYLAKIRHLREKFTELENLIEDYGGATREKSVAITQLEIAAMCATKAAAFADPNSVVDQG